MVSSGAQWLEGRVLQVLSNSVVVLGKPVAKASGAVAFYRSCLVSVVRNHQPAEGTWLRLSVVVDGSYTFVTGSNAGGSLTAYREVPEPTYEEYRKIYDRDCQAALVEPLVSVAPVTNTAPTVPVGASAEGVPTPNPAPSVSITERLRLRREALERMKAAGTTPSFVAAPSTNVVSGTTPQELEKKLHEHNMGLIRAKGAKGPPLPIALTPEEDAQLVKEGLLPAQ